MRNPDYPLTGTGPVKVIVFGGQFGVADDWVAVAAALNPDRFTVMWFDYRGYGLARGRKGDYTFEEAAGDALAAADALGWDHFSLVGHSMGGIAIQRVLQQAPGRVDRMVAITAVPACGMGFDAATTEYFEASVNDLAVREAIIDGSTSGRLPRTWLHHQAQVSQDATRPEAFAGYLKAWMSASFVSALGRPELPVLALAGEFDPAFTEPFVQRTWGTHYPNAVVRTLGNSGHYPQAEVPLALTAEIERFLGR